MGLRGAPDAGDPLPEFVHCALKESIGSLTKGAGLLALIVRGCIPLAIQRSQRRFRHHPFLGMRIPVSGTPFVEDAVLVRQGLGLLHALLNSGHRVACCPLPYKRSDVGLNTPSLMRPSTCQWQIARCSERTSTIMVGPPSTSRTWAPLNNRCVDSAIQRLSQGRYELLVGQKLM